MIDLTEKLSIQIITGLDEITIDNVTLLYNNKIESLKYLNKNFYFNNNFIKNNLNKFNPPLFNILISSYWGKTINNIKFQKYENIYVFGILKNVLNFISEDIEDLFVVYDLSINLLYFLNDNDVKSLIS